MTLSVEEKSEDDYATPTARDFVSSILWYSTYMQRWQFVCVHTIVTREIASIRYVYL
jgi:hypothetical protein